jgi:hypothetical protein
MGVLELDLIYAANNLINGVGRAAAESADGRDDQIVRSSLRAHLAPRPAPPPACARALVSRAARTIANSSVAHQSLRLISLTRL